ncbi:MAG: tryptophan 2,3-dioxygenase family protein [Planctomycetota bacterium]
MPDLNSFGDGSSDYEQYIHTQELYKLQKEPNEWANEEELMFQVVHQTMELWLKAAIQHLEQVIVWLGEDDARESTRYMNRCADLLQWLGEGLKFPESISPWDYHKIRMGLGKGSGQQSPTYQHLHTVVPRVNEAFTAFMSRNKHSIADVHKDRLGNLDTYNLVISMARFDQELMHWKYRHYGLVKRIIGNKVLSLKGVPAAVLEKDGNAPAFPDVWEVISQLTDDYNAEFVPDGPKGYGG